MHLSSRFLAIGATLFVLGIAGGAVKATRPVDRHMKVALHVVLPAWPAAAA